MPEDITRGEAKRLKDENHVHNEKVSGLSGNMKGFYDELSVVFPNIRVTSGKRNDKGSHHHTGDAIDIGKEHYDVFDYLYNTKDGLTLMNKYEVGILDETNPKNMEKTHATGPHFHIGKDSGLFKTTKTRFEQAETIQPMQSFYSQNQNFDYSDINNLEKANFNLHKNFNPEIAVGSEEFKLVLPNQTTANTFIGEIKKEQEKEDIKKENKEISKNRQILEQKQREEEEKVKVVFKAMENIRKRDIESTRKKDSIEDKIVQNQNTPFQPIDIQKDLPVLPNLFRTQ